MRENCHSIWKKFTYVLNRYRFFIHNRVTMVGKNKFSLKHVSNPVETKKYSRGLGSLSLGQCPKLSHFLYGAPYSDFVIAVLVTMLFETCLILKLFFFKYCFQTLWWSNFFTFLHNILMILHFKVELWPYTYAPLKYILMEDFKQK